MLDCHVRAFIIRPGRVFGLRLRHLTLAHYWTLEAVGSPFPRNADASIDDVVLSTLICSLPARWGRWLIQRPKALAFVIGLWSLRAKRYNPIHEVKAFSDYWTAYTAYPARLESKGKASMTCCPSSLNIAWAIMGAVGERRAWSMPMPLAISYFVSEAERNGAEYSTEDGLALARANAEAEARQRAELEGRS